jgi:inosine-uridine nucleoside N-ribohydrolase
MQKMKVIIDTDPGTDIDDLLAILFALKRNELEILGITTATYPATQRADLLRRLLHDLGHEEIPVAPGVDFPLRALEPEESARLSNPSINMNHASFAGPFGSDNHSYATSATELIHRLVEANPGEVSLLCIAPLTNIALTFELHPDLPSKLKEIILMGGETHLNRKEHNIAFDCIAADIVFRCGAKIAMGTWDVTRRIVFSQEDCDKFRNHSSPLYKALGQAIDDWHPAQSWKPGPVMYDLFPVLWVFDKDSYVCEPACVQVELFGALTRGMTVRTAGEPNMLVTTDIRIDYIRQKYWETVFG